MLILLSPSKTQETGHRYSQHTIPEFNTKAQALVNTLRQLSVIEIQELMQVSEKLAESTRQRFTSFSPSPDSANSSQALLAFRGDVFSEIEVDDYNSEAFSFAQKHLRILSGLYGVLRPLDLIQPYRLEIGGKFKPDGAANLYEYWRPELSAALRKTCSAEKHTELLNLASNEYFKAVDPEVLNLRIVNVYFKQKRNDTLRTVAIHAKKARGALTNYIIKNRLKMSSELTRFNYMGYSFAKSLSTDTELVYVQRQ